MQPGKQGTPTAPSSDISQSSAPPSRSLSTVPRVPQLPDQTKHAFKSVQSREVRQRIALICDDGRTRKDTGCQRRQKRKRCSRAGGTTLWLRSTDPHSRSFSLTGQVPHPLYTNPMTSRGHSRVLNSAGSGDAGFDGQSWWFSQRIVTVLASALYHPHRLQINALAVMNTEHRSSLAPDRTLQGHAPMRSALAHCPAGRRR
jgi:hypothetical protein